MVEFDGHHTTNERAGFLRRARRRYLLSTAVDKLWM